MTRKLLLFALLGSLPFLYSCDKLKGDVGPAGLQGEQGVAGVKGEDGDPAGAFQLTLDTASTDAMGNRAFGFSIDQGIAMVEKGAVLVYAKSGNAWFPLPGLVFFEKDASNYTFAYAVNGKNLVVQLFQLDEKPQKRKFQAIRVVIIPAANGRLNAEVDYNDYEAVRKVFNLTE